MHDVEDICPGKFKAAGNLLEVDVPGKGNGRRQHFLPQHQPLPRPRDEGKGDEENVLAFDFLIGEVMSVFPPAQ